MGASERDRFGIHVEDDGQIRREPAGGETIESPSTSSHPSPRTRPWYTSDESVKRSHRTTAPAAMAGRTTLLHVVVARGFEEEDLAQPVRLEIRIEEYRPHRFGQRGAARLPRNAPCL